MGEQREAMMVVRAELCDRLETLKGLSARASEGEVTRGIDSIRLLAAAYGMTPVVRLSEAFRRAVQEGGRNACSSSLYVDRLRDAIGCERADDQTSQAYLASVSVRLGH